MVAPEKTKGKYIKLTVDCLSSPWYEINRFPQTD